MSALEHAIPERFFNDPAQCNTEGSATQTAGLPVCPQGISAVKALALAAAQGQKIYTITREVYNNNYSIVSQKLSAHSVDTRQRVQQALDAGIEVTIHEAPITQSGWSGAGYTTIDPNTGAGGYLIDGGSNGGWYSLIATAANAVVGLAISAMLASIWLVATGGVALISINFLAATIVILGLVWLLASFLEDRNDKTYEPYQKFIGYISFLPALSGKYGPVFAFFWYFYSRIF